MHSEDRLTHSRYRFCVLMVHPCILRAGSRMLGMRVVCGTADGSPLNLALFSEGRLTHVWCARSVRMVHPWIWLYWPIWRTLSWTLRWPYNRWKSWSKNWWSWVSARWKWLSESTWVTGSTVYLTEIKSTVNLQDPTSTDRLITFSFLLYSTVFYLSYPYLPSCSGW